MTAYAYITQSQTITDRPCVLSSVLLTNTGGNEGEVTIYDGSGPETGYEVATVMVGVKESRQYRWQGLELSRGLYVGVDDKTDIVVVEWCPTGWPG